jgi:hypothetical protein
MTQIWRLLGGDFPGALVRANLSREAPKKVPGLWPLTFLSLRDPTAGLQPGPELEIEGGRRISLETVVATPAPGVAIAQLPECLCRLERLAPAPAP